MSRDLELRNPTVTGKPQLPPLMVHPALGDLPIYVHAGAIIPMQPLVQSTEEKPNGPLTLRVYAPADTSAPCAGNLYTDDGATFDFHRGAYLRLRLTCSLSPDGALTLNIPAREGDFHPWWTQYRIETIGFTPHTSQASTDGRTMPLDHTDLGYAVTVPDTGRPQAIVLH
jgi:alpha-glucosidase